MEKKRMASSGRGACGVCKKSIASRSMGMHLKSHIPDSRLLSHYIIRVKADNMFWLFFQAPSTCTLKEIDTYLRTAWLECCGHLSRFIINGTIHDINPDDPDLWRPVSSMDYKLSEVLEKGMKCTHEYDFGTTTTLNMSVLESNVPPIKNSDEITVLAAHDMVHFICDVCGKEALHVCAYCTIDTPGSILCGVCMKKHRCYTEYGADSVHDVAQSPRVGLCGYKGPATLDV